MIYTPKTKTTTIDDALGATQTKPFGYYQIAIAVLYMMKDFMTVDNIGFMVYGSLKPKWSNCMDSAPNQTFSQNCTVFETCGFQNLTYQYDFWSIVGEWGLACDKYYYISLMTTLQMAGIGIGAFFVGNVADIFGRKWTWLAILISQMLLGCLSVLSPNWQTMAAFRLMIGVMCGADLVVAWVYCSEIVNTQQRYFYRVISANVLIIYGNQPLIGYLTQRWKSYTLAANLQVIPMLIAVCFIHESPRWLLQKGRTEQATKAVQSIAKFNRMSHKLPANFILEVPKASKKQYFITHLFSTRKLTVYTLSCMFLWFAVSMIFYGMYLNIGSLGGNIYISLAIFALLGIVNMVPGIADYFSVTINRRVVLLGSLGLALAANITVGTLIAIGDKEKYAQILTVVSIIGQVSDMTSFDMAYLYCVELFPTLLRGVSGSISSFTGRVATAIAPQILYFGKYSESLPYFIFAAIGTIGWLVIFTLLPDTKNSVLPETVVDTDKIDVHVDEKDDGALEMKKF